MNKEEKAAQKKIEEDEAKRIEQEEKEAQKRGREAARQDAKLDENTPLFKVTDVGGKKGIGKLGHCMPVYDETLRQAWLDSGMVVPITRKAAAKETAAAEDKDGMNAIRTTKQGFG